MSKTVLTLSIFLLSWTVNAQVGVSYFPFQSIVALSSNTDRLIWADYKVETNTFANNIIMELSPKVNFIRRQQINYYTGAGVNFNLAYANSDLPLVNGYFIDFGARIKPIRSLANLQLIFELSPYINKELKGGSLKSRLGLGWNFKRR